MKHAAFLALFLPAAVLAEPPKDPRVPPAIEKGVNWLKANHVVQAGGAAGGTHQVGLDALVGLALLEGGVKPTDGSIVGITRHIRLAAASERETYNVALAIIFLDRLNDSADQATIQVLGCRLLVGQNAAGGWGYQTFDAMADADIARVRQTVLPRDIGLVRSRPQPDPNENPPPPPKLHPEAERLAAAFRRGARAAAAGGTDDNSNTQFAMVGLWVSQRRGVPAGKAFERVESRFLRTQSPTDYGWAYNTTASGASSPSMTCAGMLGLACAAARDEAKNSNLKFADDPNFNAAKPKDDDPFFNPPTGNTGGNDPDAPNADGPDPEEIKKNPVREAAIARGLTALGNLLKANRNALTGGIGNGWGGADDLYFIWSLERVAVGFGLETIGDVDWYRWGMEKILPSQAADGSWTGNYDRAAVTSFAILFLCRSNFVADLTRSVKGKVKDPGAAELRGSRNGLNAGGTREAVRGPGGVGGADGGPAGPGLSAVVGATTADQIAENLINATDGEWALRLRLARDNKGSQYTGGLVKAIPQLDAKRGYSAQTALAERLARMSTDTLRPMITHRDSELRRAAVLAVGMKDDKVLTRDLIDRTRDIEDAVCRAARAALRTMTEQDFGPPARSTDEQKEKAFEQWVAWFATSGRGR